MAAPHDHRLLYQTIVAATIKSLGIALTFLFFVVAAQKSSLEAYGVFASIFSLATILGFALAAGQHVTVLRFWPAWNGTRSTPIADAAMVWSLKRIGGVALLGSGAIVLLLYGLQLSGLPMPAPLQAPAALICMALAFTLSEMAQSALRARGEVVVSLSGREVLWRVLNISGLMAVGLLSGPGLIWLAAGTLAVVSLGQLLLVVRATGPRAVLSAEDRVEMARASNWLWLSTTVGPIVTHSGTIVVAMVLGPAAAGAFFAADRLAKLLSIVLIAVNQVLGPQLSRHYHAGEIDRVRRLVTLGALGSGVVALAGMAVFGLFGDVALALFDPAYREAWGALMILTLGQVVNTFAGPNSMLMNMAGLERLNTLIMGGIGALGLIVLAVSAYLWGLLGAACGASAIMVAWNVIVVIVCHRRLDIRPFDLKALRRG